MAAYAGAGRDAPPDVSDLNRVGVGERHRRVLVTERPSHSAGALVVEQSRRKVVNLGGGERKLAVVVFDHR